MTMMTYFTYLECYVCDFFSVLCITVLKQRKKHENYQSLFIVKLMQTFVLLLKIGVLA